MYFELSIAKIFEIKNLKLIGVEIEPINILNNYNSDFVNMYYTFKSIEFAYKDGNDKPCLLFTYINETDRIETINYLDKNPILYLDEQNTKYLIGELSRLPLVKKFVKETYNSFYTDKLK
jgi:hypothetical protein